MSVRSFGAEETYKYPLPASIGKKALHPKLRQTKAKINAHNNIRKGNKVNPTKEKQPFVEGGTSPTPGLENRQFSTEEQERSI